MNTCRQCGNTRHSGTCLSISVDGELSIVTCGELVCPRAWSDFQMLCSWHQEGFQALGSDGQNSDSQLVHPDREKHDRAFKERPNHLFYLF